MGPSALDMARVHTTWWLLLLAFAFAQERLDRMAPFMATSLASFVGRVLLVCVPHAVVLYCVLLVCATCCVCVSRVVGAVYVGVRAHAPVLVCARPH